MAHYFLSDVHLRADRPERDERLLRWLSERNASDSLMIVGDLCDFWMGSRAVGDASRLLESASLRALAEFRARGGDLSIMAGNHDTWLCRFYEKSLGARIVAEPHDMVVSGIRVRLVHGHLLGARRVWKALMEGRLFFEAFGRLPFAIAHQLDEALARKNEVGLFEDEERHLRVYREYAAGCGAEADLVVLGHVHRPVDEKVGTTRMVVLGGWQRGFSALKIDDAGAELCFRVERGMSGQQRATVSHNPTENV